MKAMILAAGLGKRMLPLTRDCPKPLLKVAGRPLIEHHLLRLAAAGISEVVINTAYLADKLESYLGNGKQLGVNIQYSREGKPLETAGAIAFAAPLLGKQPFILVNGDVFTDYSFESLKGIGPEIAHIVLTKKPDYLVDGDFSLSGNLLLSEPRQFTYTGIGVYNPVWFTQFPKGESIALGPILREQALAARVTAELYTGAWYDVGTPQRLATLEKNLRQH